jgi:predicted dehydrogenase
MNTDKKQARRDFLKSTAFIAGATVLSTSPVTGAFASGSDTIKIALIGCGGRGTGAAAQALSTNHNLKLVAMVDAFQDRLDESYKILSDKYKDKVDVPKEHQFVGFDAYLKAIPLADVVILATPPGFRPDHFEEAIKQNKHVFMEKPVAVDSPGIRKVLEVAKEAERKKLNVVVGLQRRYQDNYVEVINRIRDGAIGKITSGQVYWNSGGVWVHPRKPGQSEMDYQMRNWYYFNWLCGDHIVEQHVHNIDVANWILDAYPVSAQGTGSQAWRTGKDYGEIYDNHAVEFTYANGSVIYSQCRHFEGTSNRVDESFQGSKGRVYLSASNRGVLWDANGKEIYSHNPRNNRNPYQTEHDLLFDAIANNRYEFHDAERGAKSTFTAILGRYATYSGKVLSWDEALSSNISLMPDKLAWDALPKLLPDANGIYPVAQPGKSIVI